MKKVTISIYRDTEGNYHPQPFEASYTCNDWRRYLAEVNSDKLARYEALSSRKRSPKLWRLRQSEEYQMWQNAQPKDVVTSRLEAEVIAYVDGRWNQLHVRMSIVKAYRMMKLFGHSTLHATYYPNEFRGKTANEKWSVGYEIPAYVKEC